MTKKKIRHLKKYALIRKRYGISKKKFIRFKIGNYTIFNINFINNSYIIKINRKALTISQFSTFWTNQSKNFILLRPIFQLI